MVLPRGPVRLDSRRGKIIGEGEKKEREAHSPAQVDLPFRVELIIHIPEAADQVRQPEDTGHGDPNAAVSPGIN